MVAFLLLVVCLALGVLVARYAHPPIGLAPGLNWWLINIALPAMVLEMVPQLNFDPHMLFLVLSEWFIFIAAWVLFAFIGGRLGWSRGRIGALTLVAGLGNTSFIGYPMIEALRGREALGLAVVADQAGCFVALAVGGIVVSSIYSGQRPKAADVIGRVLRFPAFLALMSSVVVNLLGGWPPLIEDLLGRIAATLTPLALFVVGLRFKLHMERDQLSAVGMGLAYKLVLIPAVVLGAGLLLGIYGQMLTIGVLQASMAPMVSATILADQHHLDPPVANTLLGAGTLLGFVTVPAWSFLLG
ncbi:AEC family transporter [Solimonas marina]|uniref:AEC family transporter n=1 Tax=Solimonas marina TaxID=2714601 RepID=A0A969W9B6_9GAMM|nr:AEC family transporter [Solimonas marina]NKF20745.1 AEC family transporter [Solimonas marina]